MRNWIDKLTPPPWLVKKALLLAVLVVVGAAAFCWGRRQSVSADPPRNPYAQGTSSVDVKDYEKRIVATIYGNIHVTRAELGEYLIARFGAERLQFMINRKLVEMEGQKHNIHVTDDEVEYRFREDLKGLGGNDKVFVDGILRRFGKTLYEWKEDVIRPKLIMEKIVKARVIIGEKDIIEGFEARYGPKVECRMIVIQPGSPAAVRQVWDSARAGRTAFMQEAAKQSIPNLKETAGQVPPIHKHFGDRNLENAAFSLAPGDISDPIKLEDGTYVILMCEKKLPPDTTKKIEEERQRIGKEMYELRVVQKIPEEFTRLQQQANAQLFLTGATRNATPVSATSPRPMYQPMLEPAPAQSQAPMPMPPPPVARPIEIPKTPVTGIGLVPSAIRDLPLPAPADITLPAKK